MRKPMYFKAKTLTSDEGGWITGTPVVVKNRTYMVDTTKIVQFENGVISFYTIEIEPQTLGMFTNVVTRDGQELFEHHIVKSKTYDDNDVGVIIYKPQHGFFVDWYSIKGTMSEGGWSEDGGNSGVVDTWPLADLYADFEIIGNIFDTPELLG